MTVGGNPSYISLRDIKLAEGVNIHKWEYGMMLWAGDHFLKPKPGTDFTGGIHNEGWSETWKKWVDSLPKGSTITDDMLKEQISQMSAIDKFSKLIGKGTKPIYPTYQDWTAHLEKQRQLRNKGLNVKRPKGKGGKVSCNAFVIGATVAQLYFDARDQAQAMNNADPFVQFDTEGAMWGIMFTSEPHHYLFGFPSRFRRTTGYFIIYFTGARQDLT